MAVRQAIINGDNFTCCVLDSIPSLFYEVSDVSSSPYTLGTNFQASTEYRQWVTYFDNNILQIQGRSDTDYFPSARGYYLGVVVDQYLGTGTGYGALYCGLAFGVDEATEQGQLFLCYANPSRNSYSVAPIISNSSTQTLHYAYLAITESERVVSSFGGGATHIAKRNGLLADLSSNLSDVLIVAGGGGGALIAESTAWDGSETEIISSGGGD